MKNLKKVLVAILVISSSLASSQIKDSLSIFEANSAVRVFTDKSLYELKVRESKNFFEKFSPREAQIYFNSILKRINLDIGVVSGGGYGDIELSKNIGLRVKYGALKLNNNFYKTLNYDSKRLSGRVFGFNLGISLRNNDNINLFLSTGNDWIKIDGKENVSEFNISIGIKIKE